MSKNVDGGREEKTVSQLARPGLAYIIRQDKLVSGGTGALLHNPGLSSSCWWVVVTAKVQCACP